MCGVAGSITVRLVGAGIGVRETRQQTCRQIIGATHTLIQRVTCLRRVSTGVNRIVAMSSLVTERIYGLIEFARVIHCRMADNETVVGVKPSLECGKIPAN